LDSDGRLPPLRARVFVVVVVVVVVVVGPPCPDELALNPGIPRHRPRFQNDDDDDDPCPAESAGGGGLPSSFARRSVKPGVGGIVGCSGLESRLSLARFFSFTTRIGVLSGEPLNTLAVGLLKGLLALCRAGDAPACGCFLASPATL
jgi:hypothetical protein